MITNTMNTKDPIYDQRVRGHDFLAYFKSHMTAICLLFWFFTISVSVTASAIYLLKIREKDESLFSTPPATTVGKGDREGGRDGDESESLYHDAYANYDVLGFLIDTLYAGDEADSQNRSKQAAKTSSDPRASTKASTDDIYDGPDGSAPDEDTATTVPPDEY